MTKFYKVPLLVEQTVFSEESISALLKQHPRLYAAQQMKSVPCLGNIPGILCFCTCHPLSPFTDWVPLSDEVILTTPLNIRKEEHAQIS